MTKNQAIKAIKEIEDRCQLLIDYGVHLTFACASEELGIGFSSSVKAIETPFFICEVVKAIEEARFQQEKEKGVKESKIPFATMGEA